MRLSRHLKLHVYMRNCIVPVDMYNFFFMDYEFYLLFICTGNPPFPGYLANNIYETFNISYLMRDCEQ